MSLVKKTFIPHADIELKYPRKEVDYFLTIPEAGLNEDTGLIVVIGGCPWRADDNYVLNKLNPFLANKYNCLVAGVNFFGIGITAEVANTRFNFDENFLRNFETIYSVDRNEIVLENGTIDLQRFSQIMKDRGVHHVDPRCKALAIVDTSAYHSFGFLPAVDNLSMVGHILREYPINRKRLIAFGTSYGGYIANLMGKYAPQTFSAIIDNSGFVRTHMMYLRGEEMINGTEYFLKVPPYGCEILGTVKSPWDINDELSPNYFSDSCKKIRSLIVDGHFRPTKSKYYIFHSVEDTLVPISEKESFAELQRKYADVQFWKITAKEIDGRIFKTVNHSLGASMRGMFDIVDSSGEQAIETEKLPTDFDQGNIYSFYCGMASYLFTYSTDFELSVSIHNH